MNLRRIRLVLWALVAVALAGVLALHWAGRRPEPSQAAFRPDFALQDAAGRTYGMEDFRGRFALVSFGFTNCPDICPTTMSEVALVMDDLGSEADKVQPLFISIDPQRDRGQGLSEYLAAFHPAILGLAGDGAATQAAAESFRIHFEREESPAAPDGYTVSHSPGLFLIGPDGEWLRQFPHETPAAEILADIQERI
ncbi:MULTISPECIES: SCO family protein [Paracoccus]|uniref:SCO family protein n=1 Tax=Paracoccus TaxID=265 RepID=UPI001FB74D8D|nr:MULTISPECIES: SCO family protein [Paracoccus]MCJ1902120.1 SCO family protein [Paracoccus versutus]MDF3906856.1 SCO family protein [Paracoccus sp. AS002]